MLWQDWLHEQARENIVQLNSMEDYWDILGQCIEMPVDG